MAEQDRLAVKWDTVPWGPSLNLIRTTDATRAVVAEATPAIAAHIVQLHNASLSPQDAGQAPQAGQWVPVSERLPERGDVLVCLSEGREMHIAGINMAGNAFIDGEDFFAVFGDVSHWMPLPPAPASPQAAPASPQTKEGT